jgi:hypothetical protein
MVRKAKQPIDPAALLRVAGEVQAAVERALTSEDYAALMQRTGGEDAGSAVVYSADEKAQALDDFALDAAAESLELLAGQVRALAEQKMETAYRMALDVYYKTEELSHDPEHADLIEHVEKMRRAHESQYGFPIPPRK